MLGSQARIRPYQPADLDDLYRICLLTADNGQDATPIVSDPALPGHVWMAPFAVLEPSLVFVADDEAGLAGYVVAALDCRAFERRLEREWWPGLRARYPEPPAAAAALPNLERYALNDIHHAWETAPELAGPFPSLLHIDLLPRQQGRGVGRRLIETLAASLRDQGSPGLHLIVSDGNPRAIGFYRHLGFAQYPAQHLFPGGDLHVFTMDLRPAAY